MSNFQPTTFEIQPWILFTRGGITTNSLKLEVFVVIEGSNNSNTKKGSIWRKAGNLLTLKAATHSGACRCLSSGRKQQQLHLTAAASSSRCPSCGLTSSGARSALCPAWPKYRSLSPDWRWSAALTWKRLEEASRVPLESRRFLFSISLLSNLCPIICSGIAMETERPQSSERPWKRCLSKNKRIIIMQGKRRGAKTWLTLEGRRGERNASDYCFFLPFFCHCSKWKIGTIKYWI